MVNAKSYAPGYIPPQTSPLPSPIYQGPPTSGVTFPVTSPTAFSGPNQSRKRSFNESNDGGAGGDHGYRGGERHIKQMRRGGGRGGRDDYGGRGRGGYHPPPVSHGGHSHPIQGFPNLPMPPPPPGNFDDPMAAIMAMQAMGLPPLPGMPPFPSTSPPPLSQYGQGSPNQPKNKINAPCRDFETKGICHRGNHCPFVHKDFSISAEQEYDPKNAVMTDVQSSPTTPMGLNHPLSDPHTNGFNGGSGRGRGRGDRGGFTPGRRNNRAEYSHAGPNHDRSITTVVVEQIPEENFDEHSVRGFFSQYGNIESVEMKPYKRLALVKYSDNPSAYRAYNSPKVIFDNRFVKVFWYKPQPADDSMNGNPATTPTSATTPAEPEFDKEKFARDAEAAQKKLEEKKALLKDAEGKRQALEKQQEELARRSAEEKRKLQEKLAAKGQGSPPPGEIKKETNGTTNGDKDDNVPESTKALRAQLAALQNEAKSLGLDHALSDDTYQRGRGRGRGRGSYRGWDGYAARGSYAPRGRGSYRARGSVASAGYNLDLRPKKVAVGGVEWTGERDEALRQYLLVSPPTRWLSFADIFSTHVSMMLILYQGLGEHEDLNPSSSDPSKLVISFKQRREAESLYFGTRDIPGVGKVEMSWVSNQVSSPSKQPASDGGDVKMEGTDEDMKNGLNGRAGGEREVDFDVAEENEEDFDTAA